MIGLMGGGQLGRMMIQAAHGLGQQVVVLDPDAQGPADREKCGRKGDFFFCFSSPWNPAFQRR